MDLIIAGYVWADKKHFYLYVIVAAAGSALGGLVFFLLGRAGGELFLMKRINRADTSNCGTASKSRNFWP